MTYQIAVENRQDRYRATVIGWPNCAATGRTKEEALARLRKNLDKRLSGVEIVSMDVEVPKSHPILEFAGVFKDDPLFDEVQEEIATYRSAIEAA
jgi:predicted RNase H-like HicB family nuclease